VAEQVKPAIVQITNLQVQPGQFVGPAVPSGVGSGVIYDNQGHILTNNHVVAGAQQLQVSLPDRRSFKATVVGTDPQTDLAVVQIQGDNLPVATLGDSSQLQVGDWVVAIGNALALPGGPTVTQGVVSALGRTVQEPGDQPNTSGPFLFNVVQTDAPINPGNSGGALVNLDGQVIGINTLVAGQAEPGVQAQGIGFAIAIATAKPIADQLVSSGHAVHPFLGISYVALTPSLAAQLGTNAQSGIVVGAVMPGSPADTAGIQPRDVITAIDGQQLTDESSLAQTLSQHKPGESVTLTVERGGQQQDVSVTLGNAPTP
jgi:S1-C subfamily serine protease